MIFAGASVAESEPTPTDAGLPQLAGVDTRARTLAATSVPTAIAFRMVMEVL
jgi:hypothetical protein